MADTPVVHVGENSPEEVAYKLLLHIASVEGRNIRSTLEKPADKKWILDTYAECIKTVRYPKDRPSAG